MYSFMCIYRLKGSEVRFGDAMTGVIRTKVITRVKVMNEITLREWSAQVRSLEKDNTASGETRRATEGERARAVSEARGEREEFHFGGKEDFLEERGWPKVSNIATLTPTGFLLTGA